MNKINRRAFLTAAIGAVTTGPTTGLIASSTAKESPYKNIIYYSRAPHIDSFANIYPVSSELEMDINRIHLKFFEERKERQPQLNHLTKISISSIDVPYLSIDVPNDVYSNFVEPYRQLRDSFVREHVDKFKEIVTSGKFEKEEYPDENPPAVAVNVEDGEFKYRIVERYGFTECLTVTDKQNNRDLITIHSDRTPETQVLIGDLVNSIISQQSDITLDKVLKKFNY